MLFLGLAFFVNIDTAAADPGVIYVNASSGNDAWTGQYQFINGTNGPKKTISDGTGAVTANGIVNIADGSYTGANNRAITIAKNMTIKGQSKDKTIINGSNNNRIFIINSGVKVSLLNLTIANGRASNSNGGAIQNNGGTLTINNCNFKNNYATRTTTTTNVSAGVIYNTGILNLIGSTFTNNYVVSGSSNSAQGGAIYSTGSVNISNCTFVGNNATSSSGTATDDGGAIWTSGSLTINNSSFINNKAAGYGGGAICIGDNTILVNNVSISDSNFINNTAGYGGAIWMHSGTSLTPATITRSNFTGNNATYGGAIRNWGFLIVTASNFKNNSATEGGAINNAVNTSVLNVTGSTLTGNNATTGSVIYNTAGTSNINFNQIMNNTGSFDVYSAAGTVNATNNWWGSNVNVSSKVSGGVDVSTWFVLKLNSSPNTILSGGNSSITADLNHDQNGVYHDPSDGHIPDGTPITFTSTLGSINSAIMINGTSTVIFNAGNIPGVATITATTNGYINNTNVTIIALANIKLNQTVNTPVNVGDKVTFLVTATNNGPNTATNINIRDYIPAGLTGVTVTTSAGTYNSNTGIWTITSLTNGSSAILNITGTVSAVMAGKITNNTATEISQTENSTQLPTITAGVYTKLAEVEFHQFATPRVNVGGLVTYIVYLTNYGPDIVTYTVIEDFIPNGLLNATVTPSAGTYSNGLWTINFLDVGQTVNLTISGIAGPTMAGKNTTNKATKVAEREYDPTTLGEFTTADAYTDEADVVINQTGSYKKDKVTFIVTATNNGPDEATEINIENWIPEGLTDVIITPSFGTYDSDNGIWIIPSLNNGNSATLTITGTVLPQTTTTNLATKLSQIEYDPNEEGTTQFRVYNPLVDVTVTNNGWYYLTAEKKYQDSYVVGNTPVFMWGVRNSAVYDEATGVVAEYIIPKGFHYVGSSPSTGTITYVYDSVNQQGVLTWNIGYMPKNGSANAYVTLRVVAVGSKTADLTPIARLKSVNETDLNSTNDQNKIFGIIGQPSADIQVNQTYETFQNEGRDYVTYTIVVSNYGPSNATGVQITDKLPVGVTYISHTISNDGGSTWSDNDAAYNPSSTSGVWNIGNFDYGTGTRILKITVDVTDSPDSTIINTATRTGRVEKDSNYDNDGQSTYLTRSGSYTKRVDVTVTNNGWYYLTAEKKYQDSYVVGNTPVFMWGVRNSAVYDEATGVVAEYIIPKGFHYVGSSPSTGTITYVYDSVNQQGVLTWNIGYMPKNGSANAYVTLRVVAVGSKTADLTPIARLKSVNETDLNSTNDQNKIFGIIGQPSADIQVNQTYETFQNEGRDYVTYTIVVSNYGPSNATGVQITDKLPVGVTYISHTISNDGGSTWSDNDAAYNPSSTSGVWNIGNFDYGTGTRILKITVDVTDSPDSTIINTATRTGRVEKDSNYDNDGQSTYLIRIMQIGGGE